MKDIEKIPRLLSWVFQGFGIVIMVTGVLVTFEDLAGLVVIVFGLVFFFAGKLAKRLFTAPEGKKAVVITEQDFQSQTADGRISSNRSGSIIYVDEKATEEEIQAEKEKWISLGFEKRSDWVEGRIVEHSQHRGWLHRMTFIVWSFFSVLTIASAILFGPDDSILWLVAGVTVCITIAQLIYLIIQNVRQRKFGSSVFAMDKTPASLGAVLSGRVETQLNLGKVPKQGFKVLVKAERRWEESRVSEDDPSVMKTETLWEADAEARPIMRGSYLSVPVRIELPADGSPTTFSDSTFGVKWWLIVSANMAGVDFQAQFEIPVLR